MTCRECELRLAGDETLEETTERHLRDCADCRRVQGELRENLEALRAFREEVLPSVTISPRAVPPRSFPWMSAAAAAAVLVVAALQVWQWKPAPPGPLKLRAEPHEMTVEIKSPPPLVLTQARQHAKRPQPLKIKMLTDDPDVVIYWLVDSKEGN